MKTPYYTPFIYALTILTLTHVLPAYGEGGDKLVDESGRPVEFSLDGPAPLVESATAEDAANSKVFTGGARVAGGLVAIASMGKISLKHLLAEHALLNQKVYRQRIEGAETEVYASKETRWLKEQAKIELETKLIQFSELKARVNALKIQRSELIDAGLSQVKAREAMPPELRPTLVSQSDRLGAVITELHTKQIQLDELTPSLPEFRERIENLSEELARQREVIVQAEQRLRAELTSETAKLIESRKCIGKILKSNGVLVAVTVVGVAVSGYLIVKGGEDIYEAYSEGATLLVRPKRN